MQDHFEQCRASVLLVPRATHLATAKELATRWNTGVDLLGVQLSRIVDASFSLCESCSVSCSCHCWRPPSWAGQCRRFSCCDVSGFSKRPVAAWSHDRYAPSGSPGLDAWEGDFLRSLDLQSKKLLCELLDRLGTSGFTKFLLHARVVGIPKFDGSPDRRPLTVTSCIWRMWSRGIARHTASGWIWMPLSVFWCTTVCRCL